MDNFENKNKTEAKEKKIDWSNLMKFFVFDWAKDWTKSAMEEARIQANDFFRRVTIKVVQGLLSFLMITVGIIFLLIGLLVLINEVFGISNSIGFLIIGAVAILIGFLITRKKNKLCCHDKDCCHKQ